MVIFAKFSYHPKNLLGIATNAWVAAMLPIRCCDMSNQLALALQAGWQESRNPSGLNEETLVWNIIVQLIDRSPQPILRERCQVLVLSNYWTLSEAKSTTGYGCLDRNQFVYTTFNSLSDPASHQKYVKRGTYRIIIRAVTPQCLFLV